MSAPETRLLPVAKWFVVAWLHIRLLLDPHGGVTKISLSFPLPGLLISHCHFCCSLPLYHRVCPGIYPWIRRPLIPEVWY